jgi:hypothetical protein
MIPTLLLQLMLPALPVDTLKVGVVGDSQGNNFGVFNQHVNAMRTAGIDLLLHLGDHVQNDTPAEWLSQWTIPLAPIASIPRMGCIGNHESHTSYAANVWPIPQHPVSSIYGAAIACYGAVTVGNVRFVFLDTNEDPSIRLSLAQGGVQRAWLLAELAGTHWQAARWRVVGWHHPCITEHWDSGCFYPCLPERRWLLDSLSGSGASLCLQGHSHSYQRGAWRGMPFIISGGGGGWLDTTRCWDHPEITVATAQWHYCILDIAPDTITVTAKNTAGQQIDQVRIQ